MSRRWAGTLLLFGAVLIASTAVLIALDEPRQPPRDAPLVHRDSLVELLDCAERGECLFLDESLLDEEVRLSPVSRQLVASATRSSEFVCNVVGLCPD